MPGRPLNPVLPLPRQWSGRVRAAVIHAISLAQFALTAARVTSRRDKRAPTRQDRQIERLRQEVHLLKEELRLKDARMRRVPGRRRPY